MTLQGFFDDSGTKGKGRWMSMSGLFGDAELFAQITEEWDKYLRAQFPGRIDYFKMDEACQLSGEFNFWSPENRDAKVIQMSKVITGHGLVEISGLLDLDAFGRFEPLWKHIKPKRGDAVRHHSMGSPYMLLFQYVFMVAVAEAVERGATSPIELFFDEQAAFRPSILAGYDEIIQDESPDPKRRAVMPILPFFRSDRECLILQAADLLAGELRLSAEDYLDNPPFIGTLCKNLEVSRYFQLIDDSKMAEIHTHLLESAAREERAAMDAHKEMTCGD